MRRGARPTDGSGNVTVVQVRIGATVFDLQRRPLVIALLSAPDDDLTGLAARAKEAVGQGADLVALPAAAVTAGVPDALGEVGVGSVGVATTAAAVEALAARRIAMVLWEGPLPLPDLRRAPADRPRLLARTAAGLRPGDGVVIAPDRLAELDRIPPGVMGIVDLSTVTSRAPAAALVTVALEQGAVGFVTSSPSSVRRAAHVIRAVELAE